MKFLFITAGDIEPQIKGPYKTEKARSKAARAHKKFHGDEDGIFGLDINNNSPHTWAYSGGFFDR